MNKQGKVAKSVLARQKERQGIMSVFPAMAIILLIQIYSIYTVFTRSFTNWDGLLKHDFIGLQNYVTLITQDKFWSLLGNNLLFMLYIPITMFLGLIVALLLYQECSGWKFFRAVICLPQMLSFVVLGFLIKVFFAYSGPINGILDAIGLHALTKDWLSKPALARGVILLVLTWLNIGWQAMIFLGGLTAIDPTVLEAATVDGAGYWRRMFSVVIPMLARVIEYSVITSIINVFTGLFAIIFSITNGGPGYATTTIDYMIYLKAFVIGTDLGKACALALILLIIVAVITAAEMRISNKLDDWS